MSQDPRRTGRPEQPVDPNSIGGKLRNARKREGYESAQAFADVIPVERPTVNRWEATKGAPSKVAIERINQLLGTDFKRSDWLSEIKERAEQEANIRQAEAIDDHATDSQNKTVNLPLDAPVVERLKDASRKHPSRISAEQIVASLVYEYLDRWLANEQSEIRDELVQDTDEDSTGAADDQDTDDADNGKAQNDE